MDSGRGRHSFRPYRPTSSFNRHYENNHYNTSSNYPIFKSRFPNQGIKWRRDYCHRGTHRTTTPYRRYDNNSKKPNKDTEDEEEEERKKKLNDTARKLLSKIKTWNAEKNCHEDDSQQNVNEVVNEVGCKPNEDKTNADGKPKRIAHSKKAKLVKSKTKAKSLNQPAKTVKRYDVNKETVKDFQNRIQHKLIEELMQMPKENLQNVLNDPKINPVMEKKMSRLVRENRPLIAQKLRALAESKMKMLNCPSNSQLLEDIDKLIDPVIETDLSVLPDELIKKMENIFQVQFDYSKSNSVSQVENCQIVEDVGMEISNPEQPVKTETNEDLSLYECSTDEDDEVDVTNGVSFDSGCNLAQEASEMDIQIEENKLLGGTNSPHSVSILENKESTQSIPPSITSTSCQTDYNYQQASTQTQPTERKTLYGVPLPTEAKDESTSSLLNELNSIQTLTNKLNERRLMIFLQLARTNPSGSFISNEAIKNNFIESISNGDFSLAETLKQFFLVKQEKCLNHSTSRG